MPSKKKIGILYEVYLVDSEDPWIFDIPLASLHIRNSEGGGADHDVVLQQTNLIAEKLTELPEVQERQLYTGSILSANIVLKSLAQPPGPTTAYCLMSMDYYNKYKVISSERTHWEKQAGELSEKMKRLDNTMTSLIAVQNAERGILTRVYNLPEDQLTTRESIQWNRQEKILSTVLNEMIKWYKAEERKKRKLELQAELEWLEHEHTSQNYAYMAGVANTISNKVIRANELYDQWKTTKEDDTTEYQAMRQLSVELESERKAARSMLKAKEKKHNITLQAKKSAAREEKNAAQEKENAVQEKKNAVQEKKNAVQEKKNAVQEKKNAAQEKENAAQEKENAAQEKENAVQEKKNAVQAQAKEIQRRNGEIEKREKKEKKVSGQVRVQADRLRDQASQVSALVSEDRVAIRSIKLRNLLDAVQGILGDKIFPNNDDYKYASQTFREGLGKNSLTIQARLAKFKTLVRPHKHETIFQSLLDHEDALIMLVDPNASARLEGNMVAHDILPRISYMRAIDEVTSRKDKAVYVTFLNILVPETPDIGV